MFKQFTTLAGGPGLTVPLVPPLVNPLPGLMDRVETFLRTRLRRRPRVWAANLRSYVRFPLEDITDPDEWFRRRPEWAMLVLSEWPRDAKSAQALLALQRRHRLQLIVLAPKGGEL